MMDVCIPTVREIDVQKISSMLREAGVPYDHILIDSTTKPLGKAREALISRVTTKEFLFLDDDVYLPKGWYEQMSQYDAPWVESYALPTNPEPLKKLSNWSYKRRYGSKPYVLRPQDRGFTCATIIETDFVKDWKSPENLHYFEDKAICDHVKQKSGKCLRVPVMCDHNEPYDFFEHLKPSMKQMKDYYPRYVGLRFSVFTGLNAIRCSWNLRDFAVAKFGIRYAWGIFRWYYF